MIIVKSEAFTPYLIIGLIIDVVAPVFLFFCFDNIVPSIVVGSIIAYLLFMSWISSGRTFIFDSEKCTVQFLFYKKEYYWNELKTKEIRDYSLSFNSGQLIYDAGVIFSPKKKVRLPKIMYPSLYSIFFHPLSLVFVYFSTDKKLSYGKSYEVDEKEFVSKLREWGVELEDKRYRLIKDKDKKK